MLDWNCYKYHFLEVLQLVYYKTLISIYRHVFLTFSEILNKNSGNGFFVGLPFLAANFTSEYQFLQKEYEYRQSICFSFTFILFIFSKLFAKRAESR